MAEIVMSDGMMGATGVGGSCDADPLDASAERPLASSASGLGTTAACPICSSVHLSVYVHGREPVTLTPFVLGCARTTVLPGTILRCRDCGFGFTAVSVNERELAHMYGDMDGSAYRAEAGARRKTARQLLRIVHRYVSPGRLLDVGCASGAFLKEAADAGWQVAGVEPAKAFWVEANRAVAGRGVIIPAALQDAPVLPRSFDVVTLWDVLEHVPTPVPFLRRCATLVRPGGFLFVNVPALDSVPARLLRARWPLLIPEHLGYFSRKSLAFCGELAQAGSLLRMGRRRVYFSAGYLLQRLAQHRLPGAQVAARRIAGAGFARVTVPVWPGEIYCVWQQV